MGNIIIIGAGLSGLTAAVTIAKSGKSCSLVSLQASERAQSVLAEGGINAALDTMGEEDSFSEHYKDTMNGGADLADPDAVYALAENAPSIVRWLWETGVPFAAENGRLLLRNFGGQKKKRTAYAKSSTGKMIVTALIDEARKYEDAGLIIRYPHHEFLQLLLSPEAGEERHKTCEGVRIRDTYRGEQLELPGPVILCCGGMNGFFPGKTTGTTQNTGDAAAAVFAQGVRFSGLEMLQYHPTTIGIPGKRCLVSEAARGEGGRLFIKKNKKPWYFMEEKYPELKNLMPRDIVSREMFFVSEREDCEGPVYLDLTGLSPDTWEKKLSDLREEIIHYLNLDPAAEPVPVEPGIHYFMGGIHVDICHKTNIPGLYAAGECCSQYHGANRLGGNSLLGAVFGGKTAAESLLREHMEKEPFKEKQEKAPLPPVQEASPDFIRRLSEILLYGMSIVRSEERLKKSLEKLYEMKQEAKNSREENRLLLAEAMLRSALLRKESRGAHYREDFPSKNEAMRKILLAGYTGRELRIFFQDIPERNMV